jgi:hypothetical protein
MQANMNFYYLIGTVVIVWFLYRCYKSFGRRCLEKKDRHKDTREYCGCRLQRVHKILLAPDEGVSFRSQNGQWRWWIRRVIKFTFTKCRVHGVKLVKIDFDPISMFHAFWVKWLHGSQYKMEEQELIKAFQAKAQQLYMGGGHQSLDGRVTDTPPFSLGSMVDGVFKELSAIISGD